MEQVSSQEHDSCDITVLQEKTEEDLPSETISVIRSVTDKMSTLPVGTFKYKVFKYPGDIDIFENLEGCCTFNQAKINAALAIQSIVSRISTDESVIFTDFKAGYDHRFKIYTGVIDDSILDYNAVFIRRDIRNLYQAGLLTSDEYRELMDLAKDTPIFDEVIRLNEKLREMWIVRWTVPEILSGTKVLRGNYRLFLDVALTQGSVVKIDTVAKVEARYVEVTNFFLISQRDRFGKVIILSEELGEYSQSLLEDVHKYYKTNVLKAVKRLWMYLAFKNRICDLGLFTELFESDIALHSQIVADIETALHLRDSSANRSRTDLPGEAAPLSVKYDKEFLIRSLNQRLGLLQGECMNYRDLSDVRDCLRESVNARTIKWLSDHNIDILALAQNP